LIAPVAGLVAETVPGRYIVELTTEPVARLGKRATLQSAAASTHRGRIGVYQLNLRIPGDRMKGDALTVTLRIGGVNSPNTGSAAPSIAAH